MLRQRGGQFVLAVAVLVAIALVADSLTTNPEYSSATPAPPAGAGFGRGPQETAISGVVTCDGKPLTTGAVTFMTDDGPAGQGIIDETGRYSAGLVPEGPVKVVYATAPFTVREFTLFLGGPDPGPEADWHEQPTPAPDMARRAAAVRSRYGNMKTPLSYTVVRGPQTFDIHFITTK